MILTSFAMLVKILETSTSLKLVIHFEIPLILVSSHH